MSGYGGMFSFGHAAFFGIGAYTDAYLLVEHGDLALDQHGGRSGAGGARPACSSPTCRLRYRLAGAYFALATFAFARDAPAARAPTSALSTRPRGSTSRSCPETLGR